MTRAAVGLVVLQLALRGWVAGRGYFYWDDLILTGRSGSFPLLSRDFLLYDHDGHLMPGAFLTAGVLTALAPLRWAAAAASLVALQMLASLAVYRVLRLLLGPGPLLLLPLTFFLFSPATLPSYAWWAAGLNSLPMQAATAWMAGDAVLLCRTGRRRHAVTGTVAFGLALLFFEKSVVLPVVAFGCVALLLHVEGSPAPVRTAARRGRDLWLASGAVALAWAMVYLATVRTPPSSVRPHPAADLFWHGLSLGVLPTLLGGPWSWARVAVSTPFADPPTALVVLSWAVVAALLVASLRWKQRTGWVWLAVAGYVGLDLAAMVLGRSGAATLPELGQTLRYTADSTVVVALGMALVLRAPVRPRPAAVPTTARARRPALALVVALPVLLASCLWSTVTFTRLWADGETRPYLTTARASLAAHSTVPLLDQPVPSRVLFGLAYPNNLAAQVFSPLGTRAAFADSTPQLWMLDEAGKVVPAHVRPLRSTLPGPVPGCGYPVGAGTAGRIPLDGPLIDWDWTVELHYVARTGGTLVVSLDGSRTVRTPVRAGAGQVFVRLRGGGSGLRVAAATGSPTGCVSGAVVGLVDPGAGAGRAVTGSP